MTTAHPTITDSEILPGEEMIKTSHIIRSPGETPLEYTGERMVPEANRGQIIFIEHLARYMFAARFAEGKRVLDFGSGEGYGASILANHGAVSVSAIDISPKAIDHGRMKYPHHALEFICADCLNAPFEDNSFELVTSFEVIEHLTDHGGYMGEIRRVLKEDGSLIISTPNITKSSGDNEFHLRELGFEEFVALLKTYFRHVKIYAQTDLISSMVYDTEEKGMASFTVETIEPLPDISDSSYFLAVCSNSEIALPFSYRCMASVDEEYPRLNKLISELSTNASESNKAVQEHITIIEDQRSEIAVKDKAIDSFAREREDLLSVFHSYRDLLPLINNAQLSLRHDAISVESCQAFAQICLAVNLNDSARLFLNRILQQEPDNVTALFQIGQIYFSSGKAGLAKKYIMKALQIDPGHPGAKALIEAIGD